MINLELSQQLSQAVRALAEECFSNAYRAIQKHYPDALYIEGFAVTNLGLCLPVEHAWLEVNGEIVDPTFCNRALPVPKQYSDFAGERSDPTLALAYFPVLKLTLAKVNDFARKTGKIHFTWFQFDNDIFTDEQRQQYTTAQKAAFEFARTGSNICHE